MRTEELHWSVDRRIPIVLITGLLLQSAGIVWWARGLVADVDSERYARVELERRIAAIEQRTERERLGERMAVMESQMRIQTDLLVRIDKRINEGRP
jgi:hypothetical protein